MHVRDGNRREYAYVKLAIIQDTYVLRTWPGRSSRRRKRPPRRERRRGSLAGSIFLGPYRRPVGYTNTTHTPPLLPLGQPRRERARNGHAAGVRLRGPIRPRRSKLDRQTLFSSIEMAGKYHARTHASMWIIPGSSQTNTAAHARPGAPCISFS